jgi:hypothetical protein
MNFTTIVVRNFVQTIKLFRIAQNSRSQTFEDSKDFKIMEGSKPKKQKTKPNKIL